MSTKRELLIRVWLLEARTNHLVKAYRRLLRAYRRIAARMEDDVPKTGTVEEIIEEIDYIEVFGRLNGTVQASLIEAFMQRKCQCCVQRRYLGNAMEVLIPLGFEFVDQCIDRKHQFKIISW